MVETALTLATETLQRATQTLARLTTPKPALTPLETDDIQGLVFRGYGSLRFCCYPLLKVSDALRARAWLRSQVDAIARGKPAAKGSALHIAFSQAEPVKYAFKRTGPDSICEWNGYYMPLMPLPWCPKRS